MAALSCLDVFLRQDNDGIVLLLFDLIISLGFYIFVSVYVPLVVFLGLINVLLKVWILRKLELVLLF